jgi:thiosulfate/3-mercaptopyruvate sulfurtransferase
MSLRNALATALLLTAGTLSAQGKASIVSGDWLAQRLNDPSVVVLHMAHDDNDYRGAHIPGAREMRYSWITTMRDSIGTEFPAADSLRAVFERLGVSDNSHVVIYNSGNGMAPMSSRVFLSLDYLGHRNISLLDGGFAKWRAAGRPVNGDAVHAARGRITTPLREVTVDAAWIIANTGKKGVAFIDTRTDGEYLGTNERGGLRSLGHVAGARQLEWQQLFSNADENQFLDMAALKKLYDDRSAPGDTIVTYCLVGYRASMTYFAARVLGLPVKIYDGSYQDWARRALPVTKGPNP